MEDTQSHYNRLDAVRSRRADVEALLEVAEEPAETSEELLDRLTEAGRRLAASRPGVGAIAGAAGRVLATARLQTHLPPDELRRLVAAEVQGILGSGERAARSIAIQLAPRLPDALVLTHSASETVREALVHTPPERVVCTVSHPHEEGRAFVEELREAGVRAELIRDEDATQAVRDSTLLLLGADAVYSDGTVCNKIGTEPLARAADERGIATVVACEVLKLVPVDAADAPALEEEADIFDLTPPELIDEIVTEEGAASAHDVRALIDRTPFLSVGYELLRGAELRD